MKINIKVTNVSLSAELTLSIEHKLVGALERLLQEKAENALCEIEVGKTTLHHRSGDIFRAEINLTSEGDHVRAVSEKSDILSAIDDVRDEVVRALKHQQSKKRDIFRRGAARVKNILKGLYRGNK